jgi:anti-sigma regulatory factor (Ser/Thr protein kinase)
MRLELVVRLLPDVDDLTTFRHVLDGALKTLDVTEACRADVGLIVSEICANVVSYLTMGEHAQVGVTVDEGMCVVEVRAEDDVDPLRPNVLAESGRGLQIVSQLADTVQVYADHSRGLLLRAGKKLVTA